MTRPALGNPRRTSLRGLRGGSTRSLVYTVLRRAIISLELLPGQALSENELAARHSVSRTPVREALIRLADEGLVDVVPQLGTFVSRISVPDVVEIQFIRETLERASLPKAIRNITARDEAYLRALLDEQAEAGKNGDLQHWFATDEDLHRTLLEIGGHPRVWTIVASAKAHLDRVRMLSLPDVATLDELHAQHTAIVDHVVAKQRRQADSMLSQHLRIALDILQELEDLHPDYFVLDEDQADDLGYPPAGSRIRPARR
jgi:DNA-binding GntR family transcriptional regulator